jgi:glycosyltransferase involved in cell wall biosynthesis
MLSVVILTKNEEKMIQNCINSVKNIAGEIIAIENGSTDNTVQILQNNNCKIIQSDNPSFAVRRDLGLQNASGDWILYLDADERVTPELSTEIVNIISKNDALSGYILNRKDYYFGRERETFSPMHRLFRKSALKRWIGELHESPEVTGPVGTLDNYLVHLTHTDIHSMLINTLKWSSQEAELRFHQNHPPVVWWRLLRVMITAFWNSFVIQKGYKAGTEGWIEALYQSCSIFMTYAKLWELQNKAKIDSRYQEIEKNYQ